MAESRDRGASRPVQVVFACVVVAGLTAVVIGVGLWRGWFAHPSVTDAREVRPGAVETVATGLEAPWGLAFLPDGTALVSERDSKRILAVAAGGVRAVTRIDEAAPSGEAGLLGIAVSPDYVRDRWVYVYYTTAQDNRIARLRLGERP
ncbi:MAG TPA: PQQ-dependent sugar dehydrogenase, partial [Micromonosporaceae bacterium]|nr:PQQ-dependent sugar dehydrogenase [Micromonosporaceae bacterium]